MTLQAIEKEALHLSVEERAQLAHRLLESLDDLSSTEVERLWITEAERRAAELDRGDVQPVSAEDLEARVRAILG